MGKGTAILILGTLFLFLFGFLSRVLIIRNFPVLDWGIFSLAFALAGFLSILALLGLDQALARALAFERDDSARRAVARYGIGAAILSGAICSTAVFLLAAPLSAVFHISGISWVFQLFSVTIGVSVVAVALAAVYQGVEDVVPNAIFNEIVNPGLFVVAVLVVVLLHVGFFGVVAGYAVADVAALLALLVYAFRRSSILQKPAPIPSAPKISMAPLWRLSGSLWGVTTLAYVTAFVDTLLLGVFRSPTDVGTYSTIMILSRVLLVSNGTLTYIFLPVAARLTREGNFDGIRATYLAGTRWVTLMVAPGFLLLLLLPRLCLNTVFGPGYSSASFDLQVLVVPAFLAVVVGPSSAALAGMGRFKILLTTTMLAAATNIFLSLSLIPTYGILGASIAWGAARALYPGLGLILLYRAFRVTPFAGPLIRPLALTLGILTPVDLSVGFLNLGGWALVPLYLGGVVVAFAALLLTRSVVPGDLAVLGVAERTVRLPMPRVRQLLVARLSGGRRQFGGRDAQGAHDPIAPVPKVPARGGMET